MSHALRRAHALLDLAGLVSFLAIIALPPALHLLRGGSGAGTRMEYRAPAPLPALRPSRSFASEFEAYFDDSFALRSTLVRWNNRIKLLWLGVSPTPQFLAGREGWIFFAGGGVIEAQRGIDRFDSSELAQWRWTLEKRAAWLAGLGIPFHFVVAPDKHSIYGEMLPARLTRVRPSRYDQWQQSFERRSSFSPLDLRPALLEAKRAGLIYYPLGTHWNSAGAFAAYEKIMAKVAAELPELVPLPRPRFVPVNEGPYDNLAERMLIGDLVSQPRLGTDPPHPRCGRLVEKEPARRIRILECDAVSGPTVVFFHDSFGRGLEPYLADTFPRLVMEHGDFEKKLILRERPGLVLQQVVERSLGNVPKHWHTREKEARLRRRLEERASRDQAPEP